MFNFDKSPLASAVSVKPVTAADEILVFVVTELELVAVKLTAVLNKFVYVSLTRATSPSVEVNDNLPFPTSADKFLPCAAAASSNLSAISWNVSSLE